MMVFLSCLFDTTQLRSMGQQKLTERVDQVFQDRLFAYLAIILYITRWPKQALSI